MKESDSIVYVPLFSNVDPFPIMEDALEEELASPEEDADVGLVTTAQHMNRFEEMTDWLEERGYEVHTRRGDDRLTKEGQVLGCNYASADIDAEQVLYVGGGKFHPVGLAMEHPDKRVVIADPVNNAVSVAEHDQFQAALRLGSQGDERREVGRHLLYEDRSRPLGEGPRDRREQRERLPDHDGRGDAGPPPKLRHGRVRQHRLSPDRRRRPPGSTSRC